MRPKYNTKNQETRMGERMVVLQPRRGRLRGKDHATAREKFRAAARQLHFMRRDRSNRFSVPAGTDGADQAAIMFSRILVPTDFSPPSDAALEYARILAAKFGSTLRILHVIDDPSASSDFVGDGFAPSTEDIRNRLLRQARIRLDHMVNLVDRSRYRAHADAVVGTPAEAINDFASATGTSLIVMGTHGWTGLAHLLMGSVAEQVVRTAPCPVLTVRQLTVADEAVTHVAQDYCDTLLPVAVAV